MKISPKVGVKQDSIGGNTADGTTPNRVTGRGGNTPDGTKQPDSRPLGGNVAPDPLAGKHGKTTVG